MKIKNQLLAAALCCFAIAAQAEKLSSNPVHWDLN